MKTKILFLFLLFIFISEGLFASTKVLFLGDSLTEGYGLDEKYSYPSVLREKLNQEGFLDTVLINAGISGSTSASAMSRLNWYLKQQIDIVVLALGANDGLRGVSLEELEKNLSNAIEFIQSKKAIVILAGMKIPPNYGISYSKGFENIFITLAEQYDVAFIPFLLKGVAARPHLNLPDGIHPNKEGQEIVAENVYAVLKKFLKK